MGALSLTGLAWRGLRHHRRTAFSVGLGTAVAAAVLTGALLVGDSVRHSLRQFALQRLGHVRCALPLAHRMTRDTLVQRLREGAPDLKWVGLLKLSGLALTGDDESPGRQVNRVDVYGVSGEFWELGLRPSDRTLAADEAAVGERLAAALGVKAGDEISVRIAKPSLLPRQAPLASRKDRLSVRARLRIVRVLDDDRMGRFSLAANQVAPYNLFVSLDWLQERADLAGRVNLVLAATGIPHSGIPGAAEVTGDTADCETLNRVLRDVWQPADAGITWKRAPGTAFTQMASDRVYLDTPAADALKGTGGIGTLTYLVNGIANAFQGRTNATPYSFVVACAPSAAGAMGPVVPAMKDDEIVVNRWLADYLDAGAGDRVRMDYYALTDAGRFEARSRSFTVRSVIEMDALKAEAALLPDFPGLTDVNSCREWDIGMPMEESLLRDAANEDYWKRYRATPKAFVTLAAGQAMWGNRFGNLTGLRCTGEPAALDAALRSGVDPAMFGFSFVPVRDQALRAVEQGMDFGGLFLGMSFFLIVAALLLTGMLFAFGVEQRSEELGVLAAVGYRPRDLRRLVLAEGALQAVLGSIAGGWLGTRYTRALIYGLAHNWRDAVAGTAIGYHAEARTLFIGAASGVVCAVLALAIAVWRQSKRPPRVLLERDASLTATDLGGRVRRGRLAPTVGVACGLAAVAMVAWVAVARPERTVAVFFGAGALLLIAGLAGTRVLLGWLDSADTRPQHLRQLGRRNIARRAGRSLAVTALLACGGFIVFAVSAMKQDVGRVAHRRDSGAGGYAVFAESSFDIPDDIATAKGRRAVLADTGQWPDDLVVVSIKVHDGDDASCFNLNRAQSPRLLGVDAARFAAAGAFTPTARASLWCAIGKALPDGTIPALAGDGNTLAYGLGRKVGDVLILRDERGGSLRVRIVGALPHAVSIFQGALLIGMESFNACYPSAGYRIALVDRPASDAARRGMGVVEARLRRAGFDVTTTGGRLAEFHSVENTYLGMFLVLGGLGLVLGSFGLGVLVLRNVFERRGELAMLRCMGFTRAQVAGMVAAEHQLLVALGLGVGVGASAVAIWPSLVAPGVEVPYGLLGGLLLGMAGTGVVWTAVAARLALRGDLAASVRGE